MNPLEQLHDIEGLDFVSAWPLAIGWWILGIVVFAMALAIVSYLFYRRGFKQSWRYDTYQKLATLEKNLSNATAKETLVILSEYVRRIALRRYSRNACAGLVGKAWLKWLADHDPKKFDWEKRGVLLIQIPYAPHKEELPLPQIKELIRAVRNWVR